MSIFDFSVKEFDYDKRDGLLETQALSEPKSKKDFPYYYVDGKKIIYKPLSKTKPLTTPFFAYGEVIWSSLLNQFFDKNIPIYHLAKCNGLSDEVPKRYNIGTCVESITTPDEHLVSLYEYFLNNPDTFAECIRDYVNYCMMFYDYRMFYQTELVKNNESIGRDIARNVLYAILKADQNFHYENIALKYKGDKLISVAEMIDHEFSTHFLYPDNESAHLKYYGEYIRSLLDEYFGDKVRKIMLLGHTELGDKFKSINYLNIIEIVKLYPDLVSDFIQSLNEMIKYLLDNPINLENNDYMIPFNSDSYMEGILRYKEGKIEEADELKKGLNLYVIEPRVLNERLNSEIINSSKILKDTLEKRLTML